MAEQSSFDIVSEVDLQEVRNAVDQAGRELAPRFDFKGTDTEVNLDDTTIELRSSTEDRLKAALQVLKEKAVKRQVPLKALLRGRDPPGREGHVRQAVTRDRDLRREDQGDLEVREGQASRRSRPRSRAPRSGSWARARTTCSGHRGRQGARLRHRAAVHELPALSPAGQAVSTARGLPASSRPVPSPDLRRW